MRALWVAMTLLVGIGSARAEEKDELVRAPAVQGFVRGGLLAGTSVTLPANEVIGARLGAGVRRGRVSLALVMEGHWLPRQDSDILGDEERSAAWVFPHLAAGLEQGSWRASLHAGLAVGESRLFLPVYRLDDSVSGHVARSRRFTEAAAGAAVGWRVVELSFRYYAGRQRFEVGPPSPTTYGSGALAVVALAVTYDLGF
jgi:hypothetical protein